MYCINSKGEDMNNRTGIVVDINTGKEIEICGSKNVQNAIRTISKFGLITFSREQTFKSSHYSMHFFKPLDSLRNLYNLGNEVLVLAVNDGMSDFRSRTMDFIDYILTTREEFKNRLDKITCILIDNNSSIVDRVREDRIENPDTRLIIPFCVAELQGSITEYEFQNRFRDFLYERDLFGIASPLNNDSLFFGKDRTDVISELYGRYIQGEQGGLFGLRRIGKTSVLNLLKNRILNNNGMAVYFDCSRYHHYRWNKFLQKIIERVDEEVKTRSDDTADGLHYRIGDLFPDLGKMAYDKYDEENAIESFEKQIINAYNALGKVRILLIFDEIENIGYSTSPSVHWKEGDDSLFFWQALRSISQTNNCYFSYLITGVNPKCIEMSKINSYDNPIFGSLRPIYMSLFDYDDIKLMTSSIGGHLGLSFEEEVYAKLMEDYGGHPFLTRQVCSRINSELLDNKVARPTTVTRNSYNLHSEEYQMEMTEVIEQILGVLNTSYPDEYALLKRLAFNGRTSFKKELKGNERTIQHLLGYRLVEKDSDEYFIRIKSIETYLLNKHIYEKQLDTQEEKRNRLNARRDVIEVTLRKMIFYQLQTKYGKKAKEKLVELIKGSTTDTSQNGKIARSRNLSGALEELYFSQLGVIINKEWKDYQITFSDKTKFNMFFDLINKSRGAGDHGRKLSDEDEVMYGVAFRFFEEATSEFIDA